MLTFRDLPISRKLVRMNMIVSASVLLFACAAFMGYELFTFRKHGAEHLATDATIIGINATSALLFHDPDAAADTLAALRAIPNVMTAAIYDPDGRRFAHYVRGGHAGASMPPASLAETSVAGRANENDLIVIRPVVSDGKTIGTVYIQSDLNWIDQRLQSYAAIALGVLAAAFLGALIASRMLEKKISAPILSLAETTRTIAAKRDYSLRASVPSRDETGMLAEAFNDMLGQIEGQNATLQESERNFRELANAMPQIVWTINAGGELEYVNQRWFDYTGATGVQPGTIGAGVIHPDDQYSETWDRAFRGGTAFSAEYRMHRAADDAYRWHLVRAVPVHDKHGRVVRWFGTSTDIDDQKKAEAEVRQINAELARAARDHELLLESTGEGIFAVDTAGRCTMANRMAASVLGRRPEELLGQPIDELIHDHADATERCAIQRAFQDGTTARVVNETFARADGSSFPIEYSASPLIDEGAVRGAVVTFADVTERRRLERRLEQSDRVNSLGRMAATIAHEFNNVLMGIQPFAEMVRSHSGNDTRLQQAAARILNSVSRGKVITQDILRIARPPEADLQSVDITEWLQELAKEIQAVVGTRVVIDVQVPPRGTLFARCDPAQMQQVVTNLALNARDAMSARGTISISAGAETDVVSLTVRDSGTGITAEALPFIFEPLFTTKHSGTGLGLAVAQQLVISNGGTIGVESVAGEGTCFRIELPCAAPVLSTVVNDERPIPRQFGVRRIVIVEDDPLVASGLVSILEYEGVHARVVYRGGDAVDAVAAFSPDAVLIDIGLPDMSGTEVYERIAAKWPKLAVVFSTGHADEARLPQPALDNVGFLRKPYTSEMLLLKLREVMA